MSQNARKVNPNAEELADILMVLQRKFLMNLLLELSRKNVSFAQFSLLGYLGQEDTLTMSQIAKKMGHTTAAATGLVDRLEGMKYIQRLGDPADRRKVLVKITRKGSALVQDIQQDLVCNLSDVLDILAPEEQAMWLQIYRKIFDYVHELGCTKGE